MGFLGFLGKKPSAATSASAPPVNASSSSPAAPNVPGNLDLPELPSFDAPPSSMTGTGMDLPPLPSFDAPSVALTPPKIDDTMSKAVPAASSAPAALQPPAFPEFEQHEEHKEEVAPKVIVEEKPKAVEQSVVEVEEPAHEVNVQAPYGPVFCDVEAYRDIITNLSHAKEEILQLQTFSETGKHLQNKIQSKFESFHGSLSFMAKKLLIAEAKMFRQ